MNTEHNNNGCTPQQLVERLLTQVSSAKDLKFIRTFLTLYRFFLRPSALFEAIIQNFYGINDNCRNNATRAISQLRYLIIIHMWLKSFPGDFALPPTYNKALNFIEHVEKYRILSVAARDLSVRITNVKEDDDTYWSYYDDDNSSDEEEVNIPRVILKSEPIYDDATPMVGTLRARNHFAEENTTFIPNYNTKEKNPTICHESRYEHDSFLPRAQFEFTKIQWRQLMNEPEENIAQELTRIDWSLFSSFSARDLIRHVSLAPEAKKFYRNLGNIDRMIDQFNHVAYWVANLILIRDKAKHRAMMMVKLMKVARVRM